MIVKFKLLAVCVAVALAFSINLANTKFANAEITNNNVTVQSSSQTANSLKAVVSNTGGNVANILVDLEIHDSANNKVAQQFWDNQLIPPNNPVSFEIPIPSNLSAGAYKFSVGLFHTGWSGLIGWFGGIQNFNVGSGSGGSPSSVVLGSSSLGEFHYNNCPNITILLKNDSGAAQNVLVDTELYDSSSGSKVFQQYWDNYAVQPTTGGFDSLTTNCTLKLADSNYHYSVGIFNPGWNGNLHWYDSVQKFTVAVNPNPSTDISLQSSSLQNTTLNTVIVNKGSTSGSALIDLELQDSSGSKIDQKYFDNQTFVAGSSNNYSMTAPSNLAPGNYQFSLGIFQPGWNGLIEWDQGVQKFSTGSPQPQGQVFIQQIQRPKENVPANQSFTITPTLISQNGPVEHVTIELLLINSSTNAVVNQTSFTNQSLSNGMPENYQLTSSLPAGNYQIEIQIFNSDGSLMQQFTNIGSITVQ